MAAIRKLAAVIASRFKPARIVLFGSHAYGKPTADSDVDLLVVVTRPTDAAAVRCALPDRIPVDILVRTRDELRDRLARGDVFFREILERGRVLYETGRARVG